MSLMPHQVELLSPAKSAEIGREAILHGADAVYIGGPSFGARHNACNSVEDIAGLVEFAHRYHARIFATLNTILHDAELEPARKLIWQLYDAGVDALIVQDMGILQMDLPPIQLHASTQCDIRDADKARFLSDAGFSQIVLARELTIPQIKKIADRVADSATIEYFIHGALCVAFSGQCYISHADTGRSANRGDCSQACRLPYTLTDEKGGVVAFDKHLLSMKDNNQSANLEALLDAGVRSLKIEGRYKDVSYVKNITAHYRLLLDEIIERRPELAPASSGSSEIFFAPDPDKTFHRGATDYFATGRKQDIGAFDSPKFVGVALGTVHQVGETWLEIATSETMSNGDGINFMKKREVVGMQLNTVKQVGKVPGGLLLWRGEPNDPSVLAGLKPGTDLSRNRDHAWELALLKKSAERRVGVWLTLSESADGLVLTVTDEDGCSATASAAIALEPAKDAARAEAGLRDNLAKLGNTMFQAHDVALQLSQPWFVPASVINGLRRDAIEQLEAARLAAWPRQPRKVPVEPPVPYPEKNLSYLANVYNALAWDFYQQHGVEVIEPAYEAHQEEGEVSLMITKHCLRFSYNLCPKQAKGVKGVMGQVRADPMVLKSGNETYTLKFECRPCEMHVMGKMKKHILKSPPPSEIPSSAPITFFKQRP
ncbi:peptidase U32 family protein [Pseudogulbenkiania subflava]|uniref:Putative protease n=1 Tax=Pseudogulbenkiania subflava DSM 22618 TaxID=1123014 RepID=A0A1Y6BTN9_9NEIS|nr:U32 family peptidase [Pseudogulbenkiania subflava]SMF28290.1 putative protease [Pseudogulbenkiania subflava DSM 22618]